MEATQLSKEFATALTEKFNADEKAWLAEKFPRSTPMGYEVTIEAGRVFDRIVVNRSAHAFIERATGKLIKAATWKAPQKDKDGLAYRFDLSTPEGFEHAVAVSDRFGGYLYKQR